MTPIRYYLPAGATRPAHLPPGGIALLDGKGPDTIAGGPGGGLVVGGPYKPAETGWLAVPAGWWINPGDAIPSACVRLGPPAAILRWMAVQGVRPDHWWQVPVLLQPRPGPDGQPVAFVSALDRRWAPQGWQDPPELADLLRDLIALCLGIATGTTATNDLNVALLAARILAIGHDIHPDELAVLGWLSESMALRVLIAAADIPALPSPPATA